jgi:proteasome accessory factor C
MSSVARDRIRRCLAMIPLIRARPGIRIPELASIFGVREEEVWADITEVLTLCGVPPYLPHNYFVFSIHGDRVSIRFAEHLARPVHLTLQEALAIDLALRSLSGGRPPAFGDAAPRLRKKLRELLKGREREALEAFDRSVGGATPPDAVAETIRLVKEAMSRCRAVRLEYYTASRDTTSMRTLEPYGLVDHRGNWYVVGRDSERDAVLPFRVDRIREAALAAEEYEVPDEFTTEAYRRDEMWTEGPEDVVVKVRFAPAATARVREEAARRDLQETPDGGVIRSFRIQRSRPRWLYTHLARYGADAEVVSPPDVRAGMARFLDDLLRAHGAAPRGARAAPPPGRATTAAASVRPQRARTRRKPRDA